MNLNELKEQLIRHEGLRLKPYRDTVGKLTIGIGRNLDDVGITDLEARFLCDNDIERIMAQLDRALPWWRGLEGDRRQQALVNMTFNLGLGGVLEFEKALAAMRVGDWAVAAREMLDSKWHKDVGHRAEELAEIVRRG